MCVDWTESGFVAEAKTGLRVPIKRGKNWVQTNQDYFRFSSSSTDSPIRIGKLTVEENPNKRE